MNCLIQIFKSQSLQQLLLWVWETLVDYNEEDEDTPDCPPKSQLPYTHGRLSCPYCGQTGDTYVDGTAYCPKCRKWYCYA